MSWFPVVTIHGTLAATESVWARKESQTRASYRSDFLPWPVVSA